MQLRFLPLLCLLALASALGCESSPRYVFKPRPLVVDVPAPDGSGFVGRAVIAVLGIRPGDSKEGRLDEMALRLSLENVSQEPIGLDPASWKLVSADLQEFAAPVVEPEAAPALLPGTETTVDLSFPVRPDRPLEEYDLSGFNLRFGVRYRNATIVVSAPFERWVRAPYDPYYYGPPGPYPYMYPSSGVTIGTGFVISN